MRYRTIGKDVSLSVVGLGGFEFGSDPGWADGPALLDAAIDAGTNWIDTAEEYHDGLNEPAIAAAIGSRRDELLLSTKVAPKPDGSGFEPAQIRQACEKSLRLLNTDHIDVFFLHYPDDDLPVEGTWEAMRGLVDNGLVRLVGLSNYEREVIERCQAIGPVDVVQDGLCAIDHLENRALFRWCEEQGIGVVTYEPLGNGMLAGAINGPGDFVRVVGEDYEEWPFWQRLFSPGRFERSQAVVGGMRDVAAAIGCSLAQVALAWNLHQPGVSAALAGSTNADHVRDNAKAGDIELTDAQLAELDALIPLGPAFADGPG